VSLHFSTTALPSVDVEVDPASLKVVSRETVNVPPPATSRGPLEVRLEDGRGLFAWTDGSTYDGMHVVAQGFSGASLGAPVDLGHEGSAIGQPAAALTSGGQGVLAFIESNDAGFHLVVTKLACRDSEQGG
jgi:hypothetical protein